MKLDILDGLEKIKICTGYEIRGEKVTTPPALIEDFEEAKPLYETIPGWKTPTHLCKKLEQLPVLARRYIERLEELCATSIQIISVGPQREATVHRSL